MSKDKISKEPKSVETARDKGVNSTDLLDFVFQFISHIAIDTMSNPCNNSGMDKKV
ncbi:MAG: hypothetical protein GY928_30230 [Colwellia sp.]|nr:hypothetical protein [Colwellia sp.]